jgi:hypothetical protein
MRKVVWIVPWILLLSLSCAGEKDRAAPQTITAPGTDGTRLVIDDANRSMMVSDAAGRELSIRVDDASRMQYLDCGDFHVQGGPGYFFECTSRDFLAIEFEDLGGGRWIERYNFNGRTLEFEVFGQPTAEQHQRFLEFYETDPALNTLEANPDGAAMADLLEDAAPLLLEALQTRDPEGYEQYLARLDKDTGLPPLQMRPKWADFTCGLASTCAAIKCMFGGAANYGCVICTAIKVVCAIMDLFRWW